MRKPPLILLVDDETHIVNVLSVKLCSAGFRVTCAMDGREAIQCALLETPDLVITDYRMPLMDGQALCDNLLQLEQTQSIPVIMLTGRSHDMSGPGLDECTNIKAMIGKPFSPRGVLDKVYELLNITPEQEVSKAS